MEKTFAVSRLEIKSFDDDSRTFTGIASTPSPDRMGDIVEPKGAQYTLPIPLLWQHKSAEPIGNITAAKVTDKGIEVVGQLAQVDEPPSLKDDLDRAWSMIKNKLVRGLSIGFNPIEFAQIKDSFGLRFTKWEWLELSAVTIPANQDASIQTLKSVDMAQRRSTTGAASVNSQLDAHSPGASGPRITTKGNTLSMKTIQEQITGFEAKRAASAARMADLMSKSADEGRTLDEPETQEYDDLEKEVQGVDAHLVRLKRQQEMTVKSAEGVPGSTANVSGNQAAQGGAGNAKQQGGVIHMGKSNLPKGTGFTRYAMLKIASQGNVMQAAEMAKRYRDSTPEVETILQAEAAGIITKTAVAAGTTTDATWASPLVQYANLSSEFVELLRPQTILGRLNLRQVPFVVRIPTQTTGVSAGWVGQGAPKPVGKPGFSSTTMDFSKIAVIVAMTEELVRFSNPSAEAVVRNDMIAAIAQFSDQQFLSPGIAAVSGVSPASITYGLTPIQSSGTTIAAIVADLKALLNTFTSYNIPFDGITLIMHPNTSLALSLVRTAQDIVAFPGIDVNGGTFQGIKVVTSANVPYSASGGAMIIAVKENEIFLADDGQVTLDASREASLQMNDAPSAGAQSLVSLWQNNLVGLRAERYINWQRRRTGAVAYIDNVNY